MERWCHFFRKNHHTPIISKELFNKAQIIMRKRCKSHQYYKPMLIKNHDSYVLNSSERILLPKINQGKHNYFY